MICVECWVINPMARVSRLICVVQFQIRCFNFSSFHFISVGCWLLMLMSIRCIRLRVIYLLSIAYGWVLSLWEPPTMTLPVILVLPLPLVFSSYQSSLPSIYVFVRPLSYWYYHSRRRRRRCHCRRSRGILLLAKRWRVLTVLLVISIIININFVVF